MKVTYDATRDGLRILFNDAPIEHTADAAPGVLLDLDRNGFVVGLEVIQASQRMQNPRIVEFVEHGRANKDASAPLAE